MFTQTFTFTGSTQTFLVPFHVTSIDFKIAGGAGGFPGILQPGISPGGGLVTGNMTVTPLQMLSVLVGGQGAIYGGYGGGPGRGNGGDGGTSLGTFNPGGGGGGASHIDDASGNVLVIAGGGGGMQQRAGGGSGGPAGAPANDGQSFLQAGGGQGGQGNGVGGIGGVNTSPGSSNGQPGSTLDGGDGGSATPLMLSGGGGGGGSGGGGGGATGANGNSGAGGGGGANGATSTAENIVVLSTSTSLSPPVPGIPANGYVTITYNVVSPTVLTSNLSSHSVPIGQTFQDVAILSGGFNPTGTLTFSLYLLQTGSNPQDCKLITPAIQVISIPVNGNGTYPSGFFTPPPEAGTYVVMVQYSGDTLNAPAETSCADLNEVATVTPLLPTIRTHVQPRCLVLTSSKEVVHFRDEVTLENGFNPTGSLQLDLFSCPIRCCSKPVQSQILTVQGNGGYVGKFSVREKGQYVVVVIYSGDTNNTSVKTNSCDPNERITVKEEDTFGRFLCCS